MVQANICTICITVMPVLDAGLSQNADVKLVLKSVSVVRSVCIVCIISCLYDAAWCSVVSYLRPEQCC